MPTTSQVSNRSCASRVVSSPSAKHRSRCGTYALAGNGIRFVRTHIFSAFSLLLSRRPPTSARKILKFLKITCNAAELLRMEKVVTYQCQYQG